VKKEDSAAELCTRSLVRTAVLKLKCRSSRRKVARSIVETVSRSTDVTRLKEPVLGSVFSFIFYFFILVFVAVRSE
jgi:hypothetical protein